MTNLIIKHDEEGNILSWRYEVDNNYEPEENEVIDNYADHRELDHKHVNLETGRVVEDEEYVEPEAVDRSKVSEETKQAIREAREKGSTQAQLDALFEVVTGEKP